MQDHRPDDASATTTTRLLEAQLERMRGMLFGYSQLFFVHMRVYTLVAVAILVASLWQPLGGAVLVIPFLVPFVFLEASYLFWYTVFARRHAEWVERALQSRTGGAVPAAHRLEAAYFYAPDDPKIAALDLRRPLSHMSAATLGYTAGAGLLWLTGMILSLEWVGRSSGGSPILAWVPLIAIAWTATIALYLVWTWLRRPDERRLLRALDQVYPDATGPEAGGTGEVNRS
jgi:hypothetical protein